MRALREAAIVLFEQGRVAEVIAPNVAFAFHPDNAAALAPAYLEFVLRSGAAQLIRQNRAVIGRPDARTHLPGLRWNELLELGGKGVVNSDHERRRTWTAVNVS